ncbi:nuclear transport factor 2 family protein [Chitinophaga horti]|uniref:Nuclear transport factor 2 family protein n=1 Tax=Chitinophaga horti TaxID=2920382 RepID=A0ABY6IUD0_9BACT|nr:nuclear transport factor 2 family protein [Chitinophaga horti]UYQ90980.1 nuclear transport factor 2 family protein [Chitinophaga horti]
MTNLELTRKLWDASEATGSFQPIIDQFAEDVVFQATIPPGTPISGEFRGKARLQEYFDTILPQVASFEQLEPLEFVPHGEDKVIILGNDAFTLPVNGKKYSSPYATVLTFRGGMIVKMLIIQDLSGIYEAYKGQA